MADPAACYVRCYGDGFDLIMDAAVVASGVAPRGTVLTGVVEISRVEAERVLAILKTSCAGVSIGLVAVPATPRPA